MDSATNEPASSYTPQSGDRVKFSGEGVVIDVLPNGCFTVRDNDSGGSRHQFNVSAPNLSVERLPEMWRTGDVVSFPALEIEPAKMLMVRVGDDEWHCAPSCAPSGGTGIHRDRELTERWKRGNATLLVRNGRRLRSARRPNASAPFRRDLT